MEQLIHDPRITADRIVTIAVDIQKDFCEGGSLAVPQGDEIVQPMNEVMVYTRENGGTVIATRDWHPEETPHFEKWPKHCVEGTEGAEFHPALDLKPEDIIISKGMGQTDGYSGVEGISDDGRTIEQIVQPRNSKERVIVALGGLATDYCVKATVIDTANMFKDDERVTVVFIRDAMRAVNLDAEDEARAIQAMEQAGAIALTSEQIRSGYIEFAEAA